MTFRVPSGWDTEWYTENNRPVILTELKTKAAERNIPLPDRLAECLREAKATSTSEYVVCNRDGNPLSYTQFKRLWQYIVTRTTKERHYFRYEDGKRVKHTVNPVLGEKAAHNGKVVYSLDTRLKPDPQDPFATAVFFVMRQSGHHHCTDNDYKSEHMGTVCGSDLSTKRKRIDLNENSNQEIHITMGDGSVNSSIAGGVRRR